MYGREVRTPLDVWKYNYTPINFYKRVAKERTSMMRELFTTAGPPAESARRAAPPVTTRWGI